MSDRYREYGREKLVPSILDPSKMVPCTHGIYQHGSDSEETRCCRCGRAMTREELLDA